MFFISFYPLEDRTTTHAAAIYYRDQAKTWGARAAAVPDGARNQGAIREIADGYEKIAAQYERREQRERDLKQVAVSEGVRPPGFLRGRTPLLSFAPARQRAPHTPRPAPKMPAAPAYRSGRELCDECAPPALARTRDSPPSMAPLRDGNLRSSAGVARQEEIPSMWPAETPPGASPGQTVWRAAKLAIQRHRHGAQRHHRAGDLGP